MALKSIEAHNAERLAKYRAMDPAPNGIACPECGKELWDSTPNAMLDTDPPEKAVHCPACGWVGSVLA